MNQNNERNQFLNKNSYVKPTRYNHSGKCYMCHCDIKNDVGVNNQRLCKLCDEINNYKRTELCNLNKRIALVTGGRIKIGYETSLKLLRSGAYVIVTSRFPVDAANRYIKENDFENWGDRLKIYKVDFRNILQVERLTDFLSKRLPYLDIIINNAAQTIKRPSGFYNHLKEIEERPYESLPEKIRQLIYEDNFNIDFFDLQNNIDALGINKLINVKVVTENSATDFPEGKFDKDGQQIDERKHNSWVAKADEVGTVELLEVHIVNSMVPFMLNTQLKSLLIKSPNKDKYIVNVSAMEGKYNRKNKNIFHAHTNMAKASLNMMTRTCGEDYARSGIYMNSVDTGWITDENPGYIIAKNKAKGITPPIDEIDGAARVCDPIFNSINTGKVSFGYFFKDFHKTNW